MLHLLLRLHGMNERNESDRGSCTSLCVEWIVIVVHWCDFRHGEYEVCVPGSERHDIADQSGGLQPGIGNYFVINWIKFTECSWGHSSLCSSFLTKMTQAYLGFAWQVPVSWNWASCGSDFWVVMPGS